MNRREFLAAAGNVVLAAAIPTAMLAPAPAPAQAPRLSTADHDRYVEVFCPLTPGVTIFNVASGVALPMSGRLLACPEEGWAAIDDERWYVFCLDMELLASRGSGAQRFFMERDAIRASIAGSTVRTGPPREVVFVDHDVVTRGSALEWFLRPHLFSRGA